MNRDIPSAFAGNAGEFFVLAELTRRGWTAGLTARNNRAYDIVATRDESFASIRVETKSSKSFQWNAKPDGTIFFDAPTVAQCRADQRLWISKLTPGAKDVSFTELLDWDDNCLGCARSKRLLASTIRLAIAASMLRKSIEEEAMVKSLLVLLILVAPSFSQRESNQTDGNYLLQTCRDAVKYVDGEKLDPNSLSGATFCMGYISGVLDLDAMWESFDKENLGRHACLPKGGEVRAGQGARVIVKWLTDNPDKLHWRGETVVLRAFREAFPCN